MIYSLALWVIFFFGLIGLNAWLESADKKKTGSAAAPPSAPAGA